MTDFDQLIDRLKEELGPVADFLTEAITKQILVGGVVNVTLLIVSLGLTWLLWKRVHPWFLIKKEEMKDAGRYQQDNWRIAHGVAMTAGGLTLVLLIAINGFRLLQRLINPEWIALELLRSLAS